MNLVDIVHRAAKDAGLDSTVAELAERIANDHRPYLDDAYLFSNTKDNERSHFGAARRMLKDGLASTFWIVNGADANGFPGYGKWKRGTGKAIGYDNWLEWVAGTLVGYNKRVKPVPIQNRHGVNTVSESQALVAFSEKSGKHFWYSVAPEFHILRAYMTLASEIIKSGYSMTVFAQIGDPLPWDERALHSQGTLVATRAELLAVHEMKRIRDYKNILPAIEIIRYMESRNLPATTS